jgi:hypothetical protein
MVEVAINTNSNEVGELALNMIKDLWGIGKVTPLKNLC